MIATIHMGPEEFDRLPTATFDQVLDLLCGMDLITFPKELKTQLNGQWIKLWHSHGEWTWWYIAVHSGEKTTHYIEFILDGSVLAPDAPTKATAPKVKT